MTTKERHEPCKARYPANEACLVERNGRVKGRGVCAFTALFSCWDDPHRSLMLVAEGLREQVPVLVHGLMKRLPLQRALRLMVDRGRANGSIPARTTRLSTSRRLQSAWDPGLT